MSIILDLTDKPEDPIKAILWLTGVLEKAKSELDEAYAEEYAKTRMDNTFEHALKVGPYSRRRALALTRRWNNERGRMIHWNDFRDPSSHRV